MRNGLTDASANKDVDLAATAMVVPAAAESLRKWRRVVFISLSNAKHDRSEKSLLGILASAHDFSRNHGIQRERLLGCDQQSIGGGQMKIRSLPGSAFDWLQRTRYKWLLVMVLLCLTLRENYPFSNFPMYSSFANHDYHVYLASRDGHPLATPRFGLSTSTLKKIFDRHRRAELKKLADRADASLAEEAAAKSLLDYLDGLTATQPKAKKLLPGVRVEYVRISQKSGALLLNTRTLATHE